MVVYPFILWNKYAKRSELCVCARLCARVHQLLCIQGRNCNRELDSCKCSLTGFSLHQNGFCLETNNLLRPVEIFNAYCSVIDVGRQSSSLVCHVQPISHMENAYMLAYAPHSLEQQQQQAAKAARKTKHIEKCIDFILFTRLPLFFIHSVWLRYLAFYSFFLFYSLVFRQFSAYKHAIIMAN